MGDGASQFNALTYWNLTFHFLKIETIKTKQKVPSISSKNFCQIK